MGRLLAVLVATILIGASQLLYCNAICNGNFFPENIESYFPRLEPLLHPGDIFATTYAFTCSGNITHWEAIVTGGGAHQIEFQVWRDAPGLAEYALVGANLFPNASPTNGLLQLSVPEADQIQVSPGDFVGISTRVGTENDPFVLQRILSTYINYNLTDRGHDTAPDDLSLSTSELCVLNPSESSLGQILPATPFINAVVQSSSNPNGQPGGSTTQTTPTTSATTTALPSTTQTLIIVTAVLGGLLVALFIFFIITILVVCCCYVRRTKQADVQLTPPGTRELPMSPNSAYNNARPVMSVNEAYNDTTAGSNDPYYSSINT